MQPQSDVFTYAAAFAVAMGVISTLFGWMLNRIFSELDKLKDSDVALAKAISDLQPLMIDRNVFDRHVDKEERELAELRVEMQRAVDAVQVTVQQMVKEQQETRILLERLLTRERQ